jgi:cyanophycinase
VEGLLVLNGGEEFQPGNEPQDELLVEAAGEGPAFVVPTAAARQHPEAAVVNAIRWFARLGLQVRELPVLKKRDAQSEKLAVEAAQGTFFYLVGGDPGLVVEVLRGSLVWAAMVRGWAAGRAALAGSSAGAMAIADQTLVMARWPHHDVRRAKPALGLVPGVAVLPHYERFGRRWTDSEIVDAPSGLVLLGLDEKTAAVWDGTRWTALGAGAVTLAGRTFRGGAGVEGLPAPRAQEPGG